MFLMCLPVCACVADRVDAFPDRFVIEFLSFVVLPSVLRRCWLGGRKGIRPVKKLSGGVLAWLSVWSEVQTCIRPS